MIKRIERYQFEHINMIKNASIHLHIVEKLRKVVQMEKWENRKDS